MALKYLGLTPKAKYCRRFATNKQYNFRTYATAMTKLIPFFFSVVFVCLLPFYACSAVEAESPEYSQVASILRKYCASCHNDDDLEGGLSLGSYDAMLRGGERGAVITPRRGDLSLTDTGQTRTEPSVEAVLFMFLFNFLLNLFPFDAERGIGKHVVEVFPG